MNNKKKKKHVRQGSELVSEADILLSAPVRGGKNLQWTKEGLPFKGWSFLGIGSTGKRA